MKTIYEYGPGYRIDIEEEFYCLREEGYSVREATEMILNFLIDNRIPASYMDIANYFTCYMQ